MDEKTTNLLTQYEEQRVQLVKMITEIEKFKDKLEYLMPESLDKRNVYFFENKIKAITEFFKSLLEIRKEITKSIKDELEIRRKIDKDVYDSEDSEDDIRGIVKRIEDLRKDLKEKEQISENKDQKKVGIIQ